MTLIYKICTAEEWRDAERLGRFIGSAVDKADGFIHFSTAEQAGETARKHFAGQSDLVLVTVDTEKLTDALKWEESRGGALFPHLYEPLDVSAVAEVRSLRLGEDEAHVFPTLL
ncbi:MAG: DUF952 domain-containing protein [Alphaproteobacteria bacterium]|nr:DUF952 domain-containing protein [Alphaproteobacteria bacterium]